MLQRLVLGALLLVRIAANQLLIRSFDMPSSCAAGMYVVTFIISSLYLVFSGKKTLKSGREHSHEEGTPLIKH
jgi:hypothetical protein